MKPSSEQKEILSHTGGHTLIAAGAGSGKTKTLTLKVKAIINNNKPPIQPNEVIVLSFSKDTVTDFRTRLTKEIGADNARAVNVYTFHALGLKLITQHHKALGFESCPKVKAKNFVPIKLIERIADNHFNNINIKQHSKNKQDSDKPLTKKQFRKRLKKAFVKFRIGVNNKTSSTKADNKPVSSVLDTALKDLCQQYQEFKRKKNFIDFSDMLSLMLKLFNDKRVLKKVSSQYRYLLVDELQDINQEQARLIKLLAKKIGNSILVGDVKQSIYGFRGSSPKHWDYLVKELRPKKFYLTESFRCPKRAMKLINGVAKDINDDPVLTSNQQGCVPTRYIFKDVDEQADFLAKKITQLVAVKGTPLNDIVVLARRNTSLRVLKSALEFRDVDVIEDVTLNKKYRKAVKQSFKLVRSLLRITKWASIGGASIDGVSNHGTPLPKKSLKFIIQFLHVDEAMRDILFDNVIEEGWEEGFKFRKKQTGKNIKKCRGYNDVSSVRKAVTEASLCSLPTPSCDETLSNNKTSKSSSSSSPAETATALAEHALLILLDVAQTLINKRYKDYKKHIQRDLSSLCSTVRGMELDNINTADMKPLIPNEGVLLSTAHGAKGREWKYVFILHVVDGEWPLLKLKNGISAGEKQESIDEDRRLMYVAITRHSHKLFVCQTPVANQHYKNKGGKASIKNSNFNIESRFITPVSGTVKTLQDGKHVYIDKD